MGKNYYRVKLYDIDRSFTYSRIASLVVGTSVGDLISIFPNPLQNDEYLNISVPRVSNSLTLKVYNALGATLIDAKLRTNSNNRFSKKLLSKGINLVVIEEPGGIVKTEKIVH